MTPRTKDGDKPAPKRSADPEVDEIVLRLHARWDHASPPLPDLDEEVDDDDAPPRPRDIFDALEVF